VASVWDRALIEEEGMGGLLAVNRGSTEPPTFTVLEWMPENRRNDHPVVLVGKGVTFDTGGLSLKPTLDSMDAMKSDMAGAAAVIGAMEAIARLELPLYVVGLVPASDNRPGENAYVPGDVVRMHSGKTVEVLNTDAEGRMLLADALSYAKTYNPEIVIDLATLTGAAVVALGQHAAAIMTSEDGGAAERLAAMEAAGTRAGERVHPLPMFAAYAKDLESDVADLKNVGGRAAGAVTAAKFLEHFVAYPWIHVDIAGPSFLKKALPYRPVGGTGFGVRLLVEYLRSYADRKRG
jgi:leucyl aminopeptidase